MMYNQYLIKEKCFSKYFNVHLHHLQNNRKESDSTNCPTCSFFSLYKQ